jgi:hypothetical protein
MAYMHKQTFDIQLLGRSDYEYSKLNSTYANDDNYFQVDDLIAMPVQVLNRKGYTTAAACAGHPFTAVSPSTDELLPSHSYIIFEKGILLPSLPPGFVPYEQNANTGRTDKIEMPIKAKHMGKYGCVLIQCTFYGDNDITIYDILRGNFEAMEALYKWTLDLPGGA